MARTRTRSLDQSDENNQQAENGAVESDSRRRRRRSTETDDNTSQQLSTRKDRPTPARQAKPRGTGSSGLVNRIWGIRHMVAYFRGVAGELGKVTWPSREETTRLTAVVLGVTAAFAIVLGLLDSFFGWWFRRAFHADDTTFLLVGVALMILAGGTYTLFRNRI